MHTHASTPARALILAAAAILAGCSDSPTAPPGIQPQIVNNVDAFTYQITNLDNVTGSWDYSWENTGTMAKVSHSSDAGSSGTATVTLRDAMGTQVYSDTLATSGQPISAAGVAGTWMITVTYAGYSNTQVNFAVLKQ